MKKNHGFTLTKEDKVAEIEAQARVFRHEQSGARLLNLACDDDNKVFTIFFATPPADSTGVAHILEHSVLCGSRRFPVREPFVELMKGSLNTFLNAFTFADKTGYPVASRNEDDLFNLMDVYLDAVFYPAIYQKPEIFAQEGWHYQMPEPYSPISINGVVYNEMKGAFSSPEQVLYRKISQSLFPDTPYGVESGGDPEDIPKLSYDDFINFHRRYYHPANSFIILYGDGDLDRQLAFLDNYLNKFNDNGLNLEIASQPPFQQRRLVSENYPLGDDEEIGEKSYFALNHVCGSILEHETCLGIYILNRILLETEASPLKKALIDAGIGREINGYFDNDIKQPVLSIIVKQANEEDRERLLQIVDQTLNKIVTGGLDRKLVAAAINNIEFQLREADFQSFPRGLVYTIQAMASWLHDGDPLTPLRYEAHLKKIKEKTGDGYFEKLIKSFLLTNPHSSLVSLIPEPGLASLKQKREEKRLAELKAGQTEEDLQAIHLQSQALTKHQEKTDSPEALAAMPLLPLSAIKPECEKLPLLELTPDTLLHPVSANNIVYLSLYFDSSQVPADLIPYLGLLPSILGRVDSGRRGYMDLSNEINIHLGGLSFDTQAFALYGERDRYFPKFTINTRIIQGKEKEMTALLTEIVQTSDFTSHNRLKELIRELRSQLEMEIMEMGHAYGRRRIAACLRERGAYNELTCGISFYRFVADLDDNFNQLAPGIESALNRLCHLCFNRDLLLTSITGREDHCRQTLAALAKMTRALPMATGQQQDYKLKREPLNEGFIIPGQVQYVARGSDLSRGNCSYQHNMMVLQKVINTDYLWHQIRVLGGAYGAGANFSHDGSVFFSSYRDPHLTRSIQTYNQAGNFLKEFNPGKREMNKYLIGTMGRLDSPLTPSMKGERAALHHICRIDDQQQQKERDEILATRPEELSSYGQPLNRAMAEGCSCVIGSQAAINRNEKIFQQVSNLL